MHAGVLAQMAQNSFPSANGLGMPAASGLASRRGGQNIKPLSIDAIKSPTDKDNSVPTPRTSRSHLLAGLRTAPKSATATNFPASPTTQGPSMPARNHSISGNVFVNGPKTSMPSLGSHHQQAQQQAQQEAAQALYLQQQYQQLQQQQQQQLKLQQLQQLQQQQAQMHNAMGMHYPVEQVMASHLEQLQEQMDPATYADLIATNYSLAQQHHRLTQQLATLQAQLQGLNLNSHHQQLLQQQQYALYQQQQQLQNAQQTIYTYIDPITGQQGYVVEPSPIQASNAALEQAQLYAQLQQQQQLQQMQQAQMLQKSQSPVPQQLQQSRMSTPRVQVSPPPAENATPTPVRNVSPPRRYDSPVEPTPLPPPSANAFRRGHKKSSSLANVNPGLKTPGQDVPPSAGPKTASFPLTPAVATHGPGQGRAGEHPIREPRGPPQIDELRAAPTSKHTGSKNFVHQARRYAVTNLVRAGMERRKGTASSNGSMSPVSESAEELETPLTEDNESDSGRSGSGSLAGDIDCKSSRGSWGPIGSDRPSSRSKAYNRNSIESSGSATSPCDSDASFAGVFKKSQESTDERRAPRLVLTSADKRRASGMQL